MRTLKMVYGPSGNTLIFLSRLYAIVRTQTAPAVAKVERDTMCNAVSCIYLQTAMGHN